MDYFDTTPDKSFEQFRRELFEEVRKDTSEFKTKVKEARDLVAGIDNPTDEEKGVINALMEIRDTGRFNFFMWNTIDLYVNRKREEKSGPDEYIIF